MVAKARCVRTGEGSRSGLMTHRFTFGLVSFWGTRICYLFHRVIYFKKYGRKSKFLSTIRIGGFLHWSLRISLNFATWEQQMDIPSPPFEYKTLVCGKGGEGDYDKVGAGAVGFLKHLGLLGPDVRFLDVGCGSGHVAVI